MIKTIYIIRTDRNKNHAYTAFGQDDPYWWTNISVKLDWIEKVMGCRFDDGEHPFVSVELSENIVGKGNTEVQYYYPTVKQDIIEI